MKNKTPQVSVVIPLYNQAQYFTEAVESALGQTYRDFEIIVVDDGSTDDSAVVAQQYSDSVRYIRQANQGLAGARNTGIRAARADLVALLDSDDVWLPTYLERIMGLVAQYRQAVVYYCRAQCMDAEGRDLFQLLGGPVVPPDTIYQTLLRANFLIPSTVTMRRSVVVTADLFDVAFRRLQDWELWIRLLKQGHRFVGLEDVLVRYRIHGSSLSVDPTGGQRAAMALAAKNFGPDDGHWQDWSSDKRRAYGGVYRYHLLTSVQRQEDWDAGALNLRQALRADPSLAVDLNLFYDLALGSQPPGYRGTPYQVNLDENANHISSLLSDVFGSSAASELESVRRQTYGTAHYALGLVAYNTGQISPSRRFLLKALYYRPELSRDGLVMGNLVKSLINRYLLGRIRKYGVQARNWWWSARAE